MVVIKLFCLVKSQKLVGAMRSAFWSAKSEALYSAEHYGPRLKNHGKISNLCTFLLYYLDYELLLRSLRSLRSN